MGINPIDLVYASMILFYIWALYNMLKYLHRDGKRYGTYTNENAWTIILMIVSLTISIILIISFMEFEPEEYNNPKTAYYLWLLYGGFPVIQWITLLSATGLQKLFHHPKLKATGKEFSLMIDSSDKRIKLHLYRKAFHIFFFFALLGLFLAIGIDYAEKPYYDPHAFWGDYDGSSAIIQMLDPEVPFLVGQAIMIGAYYGATVVTLTIEFAKLSDYLRYPLVLQIQRTQHKSELHTFATHSHVSVGNLLAALLLPPNILFATFILFTFGDTAAAIVGIKMGRHKLPGSNKSYEGLIAGIIISVLGAYPFVGMLWAVLTGVLYAVIDLLSPKYLRASDNLLFPLCALILYCILGLSGVSASFPVAEWLNLIPS